jgi:hypothetical protein
MAADVTNPQPSPSGLALKALGVAEESKLAGKNLDLNGDGEISESEIRAALDQVKKEERGPRLGTPNLRLVQGGTSADQVPAELVGAQVAGAKQVEDRQEPSLADVTVKFFNREIFELIRRSLAMKGELPSLPPLEAEIVSMQLGDMRELMRGRVGELLLSKGLDHMAPESFKRAVA